ncbi:4-hydroxyphenylacetate 3-monooxygenase, reductase component [Paraburkholderia sp. BCC1886]|uniref:4-hydroxyphenylacetate 3-monooxygenase, reductase component n=1 Tax=Paraburkholderia sp. BCC1886 TaxID=2562670 RepID=UPI0011825843|nr:4-hydroxyphenylacetate 3-monooxygenase, reductase component [Paraburkholderia sp. BCC1886]
MSATTTTTTTTTSAQQQFRDAMARLAAAVNVITTDGPGGRCGITASAVCSVTDSPPTMLVCINQTSFVHDVLRENGNVCINVLGASAQETAKTFAGMTGCSMEERFENTVWHQGVLPVPVLSDAVVRLEGTVNEIKTVGTHSVMFVRIHHIDLHECHDSLVYFARRFHQLPGDRAINPAYTTADI